MTCYNLEEIFCNIHVMSIACVTLCVSTSLNLLHSHFRRVSLFAWLKNGLEHWNELWNGLKKQSKSIFNSNTWLCYALV